MISVLVTGTGGGVGQGVIKSLRMIKELDIKVIAADMSENAAGLYSGDVAYLVDRCDSDRYMESLEKIFSEENVDFYIPGTDVELIFCAKNKSLIKEKYNVTVVVCSLETIEVADDKYKTYEFLKANNLAYPETFSADQVNIADIKYPVIVKPRVGCRSIGVFKVLDEEELLAHLENPEGIIVQEYIGSADQEYTCTIAKSNGKVSPVLALKRVLRSGDTFRAIPVKSQIIEDYVRAIAERLDVSGGCNFQLRVSDDGVPKLFEINSRFSGTTPFCSQLGFNPVEYYLKEQLGLDNSVDIDYDAVVMRYWSESVVSTKQVSDLAESGSITPDKKVNFSLF